jgi:NAD(P)-dependent dehydrogenase (short-subunit alcohol dehydrogenase family)/acyl carrier protein
VFIEIGPDGTLSALGAGGEHEDAVFIPVLRPAEPAVPAVLAALARAHVHGASADWAAVLGSGRRVDLPTYAFQHQRYWPPARRRRAPERSGPVPVGPEGWRYQITWAPLAEPDRAVLSGTWLLVVPADPAGQSAQACARALEAHGARVVITGTGRETDRSGLAGQLGQALGESPAGFSGVISLLTLAEAAAAGAPVLASGLAATLVLIQALGDAGVDAPLWVLTRGAVAAGTGDPVTAPAQAAVWGLGRSAGLEHPDRWGGLIDLPAGWDERTAGRVCAVLAGCGEDQVAVRPAAILGRRLARAPLPAPRPSPAPISSVPPSPAAPSGAPRPWAPAGTVLITGGTGAIGGRIARWVAGRGGPRAVLASRSGPASAETATLAAALAGDGADAEVIACDTADRTQLTGLLARVAAGGPPLTAVMHAAGTGQGTAIQDMTAAELTAVVTAKAAGAAYLDELTAGMDLEQFVLFSSAAATWGSGGQGGYAAANAFLDALAIGRRARGLAGTSVAWGLWGGGGMGDGYGGTHMQRRGLQAMEPAQAIQALAEILDAGETQVTVADVDWTRFAPAFTIRRPSPLIDGLPEVGQALTADADPAAVGDVGPAAAGAGRSAPTLEQRLAGLAPAEQARVVLELIQGEAAAVLGLPSAATVTARRPFRELGFDSLTAIELRNRLRAATGTPLPATVIFDYPTPAVLADHLRAQAGPGTALPAEPVLAELDRLEAALAAASGTGPPGADGLRDQVTARLQTLLSGWLGTPGPAGAADVSSRLESATADEVLAFIDTELGAS